MGLRRFVFEQIIENTKIEKPNTMVIDVFNIAVPTVEWQSLRVSLYFLFKENSSLNL